MSQNIKSPHILGTENIRKLLMQYAIPAIVAMTATSMYNIMDSIFIGRGVNAMAIAGLAVTFPFVNLSAAFGSLIGVGASTVVSVRLGQKDFKSAENALGNVVLLNLIIGGTFMVLALLFLDKILMFFGASELTLPYAHDYMQILLFGNVITHVYMGLNDVMRASGYPIRAMMMTLTAVCLNAVFNSLFIFVFDMGICGAALGTVCAQIVALCSQMVHYTRSSTYLRFKKGIFKLRRQIMMAMVSIGLAPFCMNLCACLVVLLINNGLQRYGGDMYVGAYGINNRIIFLFIMIVMGFNQGMQPIVGYNYGAKLFSRVLKTVKYTIFCGASVTTIGFIICQCFPEVIIRMFTIDPMLIDIARHGLQILLLVFPLVGYQMVMTNFFQSIGIAKKAIFLSLTRQLIFLLPMLTIFPPIYGTDGIWMSFPIADTLSAIITSILFFKQIKKFKTNVI